MPLVPLPCQVAACLLLFLEEDDAFWMIQFALETKNYDDYADSIDEWARSVSFK